MKKIFRAFGLIALAAVIGFGMISCDNSGDSGGDSELKLPAYPDLNPADIAGTEVDTDGTSPSPVTLDDTQLEKFDEGGAIYFLLKEYFLANLLTQRITNTVYIEGSINQDINEFVSDTEYLHSGIDGLDGTVTGSVQQTATGATGNMKLDITYLCDSVDDTTGDWETAYDEPNPKPDYWMKAKVKAARTDSIIENQTGSSYTIALGITYLGSANFPEISGKFRFNLSETSTHFTPRGSFEGSMVGEPLFSARLIFYDNDWNQIYEHVYTYDEMAVYWDLVDGLQE